MYTHTHTLIIISIYIYIYIYYIQVNELAGHADKYTKLMCVPNVFLMCS